MNFIQQYTRYFARHPFLNILLIIIYYLSVVIPHETFGAWIARTLDEPLGRDTYNLIIMGMGVVGFLGYLFLIWNGTKSKSYSKSTWLYLALTLLLIVYCINVLMVVNVEIIHYVQYAIFAILLFPLAQSYQLTLLYTTIFGAIDEAYQYLILAPEKSNYYDFNDVFIDMIGATLGLILIRAYGIRDRKATDPFYKAPVFMGFLGVVGFLVVSFSLGWISLYVDPTIDIPFPLVKRVEPTFWTVIPPNVKFHVVRPWEWIFLTFGLWGAFRNIGKIKVPNT